MNTPELQPVHPLDRMPARQPTDFLLKRNSRALIYLIHGITGTPMEMRYLAHGLARLQWDVYVTTLPGHCRRLRDLVLSDEADWCRHVCRQLNFAKDYYDNVFVAGLSAGGLLALDATLETSVSGVAVFSPTFFYDGWTTPWYDFLLPLSMKLIPYRWQHLFFHMDGPPYGIKDEELREQIAAAYHSAHLFKEWWGAWWPSEPALALSGEEHPSASKGYPLFPLKTLTDIDRLIGRMRGRLREVTAPTLILQAKEDDLTSPRNATFVYDGISSIDKKLILLEDCYHVITIDKQKREVVRHLHDFFKTTRPLS